jgi:hypothetical protein
MSPVASSVASSKIASQAVASLKNEPRKSWSRARREVSQGVVSYPHTPSACDASPGLRVERIQDQKHNSIGHDKHKLAGQGAGPVNETLRGAGPGIPWSLWLWMGHRVSVSRSLANSCPALVSAGPPPAWRPLRRPPLFPKRPCAFGRGMVRVISRPGV